MASNSTADGKDRFFSALIYVIPLIDAFMFGGFLLQQFPVLQIIYLPIMPLLQFYYQFPFASFIIFIVLFMAVVRNNNISHFIRFNAMQAILIGILLSLFGLIVAYVIQPVFGQGLVTETLYNFAFLGALACGFFGIIQSVLGRYAEIPTISDAAYSQVRF
ncbi:Tic20 family protein [Synechocystis sp. CACIAM 05]|uniref:Tic20 family protein n=1 Tax=Synechocystis sp. CACIAM 05 TaxID=1933929 RepID=UPI00138E84D8|nr:Tic20 family protein [Synechocystis sp. CACIAM 05]QHU99450.1 hypothetical protein BWK47_04455 [Synechocystis sp. CACIAM 05]